MDERSLDAVGGIVVPDGDVTFVYNTFGLRPKPVPPATSVAGSNGLFARHIADRVSFNPALRDGEDVVLNHAMAGAGLATATLGNLLVDHREAKGFVQSVCWLYQSGRGATRQLVCYRQVRTPDLVTAGQLVALAAAVWARRRGAPRPVASAAPVGFLVAAWWAHLRGKFERRGNGAAFALATATNTVLVASYLMGRLSGLPQALASWRDLEQGR